MARRWNGRAGETFPFLFGGTFIEGTASHNEPSKTWDFPSFSEGLSLRDIYLLRYLSSSSDFPSFSEGLSLRDQLPTVRARRRPNFPSFSEGLSLRAMSALAILRSAAISLPFRRDFH